MRHVRLIAIGALALCVAALVWLALSQPEMLPRLLRPTGLTNLMPAKPPEAGSGAASRGQNRAGPVAVEAKAARQARTSSDILAVGSLQSDESVQLASELAGRIAEIPFREGEAVKAGGVIAKLDDALVRAEVQDAEARLTFARQNNERARALLRTGAGTERTRDEALSNFEIANAALELARTRLDKHTLRAPFDGVAGVRSVSVGAYVAAGTPIVNIEKIDSLKVDFKVPELYLNDIKVDQKLDVTVDALPGRTFIAEIYAINPQVDVNGRALQIRARLANPGMVLRPGLFARITIKSLAEREVTLVPESAVVPRGGDAFVFRIDNGQAIEARVKLGNRKDAEVEILEGLDPTATVVTAGQQKLKNGTSVEIVSARPAPSADNPAPEAKPAGAGGSG